MINDRRRHERVNLKWDDIPGVFYLEAHGETVQFKHVNDLSISGMGIDFHRPLDKDSDIGLRYVADDFQVHLGGKVIWCENSQAADGQRFRLGIRFNPTSMIDNVMFFMTLRAYADEFGKTL